MTTAIKDNTKEDGDATFTLLLYRLDRLEEEQRKENQDIMRLLQNIQESQNSINETIVLHSAELKQTNARLKNLENNKTNKKEFNITINEITKRLDTYKQLLTAVGGGVAVSLLIELVKMI